MEISLNPTPDFYFKFRGQNGQSNTEQTDTPIL